MPFDPESNQPVLGHGHTTEMTELVRFYNWAYSIQTLIRSYQIWRDRSAFRGHLKGIIKSDFKSYYPEIFQGRPRLVDGKPVVCLDAHPDIVLERVIELSKAMAFCHNSDVSSAFYPDCLTINTTPCPSACKWKVQKLWTPR